ncbi:unnamed protein product [Didymodactylos carnosus]|uniref:Uncharacterized protein n=1 Tax=Didymodactylos carnosus TaxID=1234261 RepID=A0A815ZK38_9BILA|nr:unnamed protein product [Didymodactylos carnosus]CAF4454455.1 unnamed protein product [Didymodactylos carnosus]
MKDPLKSYPISKQVLAPFNHITINSSITIPNDREIVKLIQSIRQLRGGFIKKFSEKPTNKMDIRDSMTITIDIGTLIMTCLSLMGIIGYLIADKSKRKAKQAKTPPTVPIATILSDKKAFLGITQMIDQQHLRVVPPS